MKHSKSISLCLICFFLLTGCWDQNLLKDVKLVMVTGFDLTPKGKILNSVSSPLFTATPGGVEIEKSQVVSAVGNTSRDARDKLDNKVSERFDASKLMVILLGESYAKKDIYPAFDVLYRNPSSSLLASIFVVDGKASEILHIKTGEKKPIGEYLTDYMRSLQATTLVPIQASPMITDLYDSGMDLALPLLHHNKNQIELKGLALFNEHRYSGMYLTPKETLLYLLMDDQKGKKASINLQIDQHKKLEMNNYITINITKANPDMKIKADHPNDVSAVINLNLEVEVIEDPEEQLTSPTKVKELNKKISEVLTDQANAVLKKTQKANSDILGVGMRVSAFHHDTWEKMNWNKDYPTLDLRTNVDVTIVKHGIFN